MQPDKPHLFIGSSQESKDQNIVDLFSDVLCKDAHCIPWWLAPQFSTEGTSTTFAALCDAAKDFDYALFILTPDDIAESRNKKSPTPRDNVVFELGLFMGAIGPERIFAALQRTKDELKIPSDLRGVTIPRFDFAATDGTKSVASIRDASSGFAKQIRKLGFRKIDLLLVYQWSFNTDLRRFEVELSAAKIVRNRREIGKWKVCLAARIDDRHTNFEDDATVVYSLPRELPEVVEENIPIEIEEAKLKRVLSPHDKIQARLLLVPEGLVFDPSQPFGAALKARCREVERLSYTLGEPKDRA